VFFEDVLPHGLVIALNGLLAWGSSSFFTRSKIQEDFHIGLLQSSLPYGYRTMPQHAAEQSSQHDETTHIMGPLLSHALCLMACDDALADQRR
jgi:hypothetical protein